MTLPTTNLSFSALQTEFGGSNPISLGEYRRGGPYVPSGTTSAYGTIPTSNSNINIGVFRGTSAFAGITVTTGSDQYSVSGGKGTEYYYTAFSGYSSTALTTQYVDNLGNYAPFGSYTGLLFSNAVAYCYYYVTTYEVSPTEYTIYIQVTGNHTGQAYAAQIDSSTVTNYKYGSYNSGGNYTSWQWRSAGGDMVPSSSPFGADGTTHTVILV